MAVITISRQYGSGGDETAQEICRNTGFRLFDKYVLAQAAVEAGLTEQEAIDFCEDNYRMKNFFDRLFGVVRPVASVRIWKEDPSGVRLAEEVVWKAKPDGIDAVFDGIGGDYTRRGFSLLRRGGVYVGYANPRCTRSWRQPKRMRYWKAVRWPGTSFW
jgi:hypothetical protein